ncbi:protein hunchback-like [Limulus polyphemus]|uniref:Protein hunchback-like n=1 Tax=Limulus polyphemus TaxID=6850 RepID=A0ABM1T4P3_LIMPO|nr:protein hunchback-like [Limulus polyphemus]
MPETDENPPGELNPVCSPNFETPVASGAESTESVPSTNTQDDEICKEGTSLNSSNMMYLKKDFTSDDGNIMNELNKNGQNVTSTLEDACSSDKKDEDCTPLDCSFEQTNKGQKSNNSERSCSFVPIFHPSVCTSSSFEENLNSKIMVHQRVNSSDEKQTWLKPPTFFIETPKNKSLVFGQFHNFIGSNHMDPGIHLHNPSVLNNNIVKNVKEIGFQNEFLKDLSLHDDGIRSINKTNSELRTEELNPEVLKIKHSSDTVSLDESRICSRPSCTVEHPEPLVSSAGSLGMTQTFSLSNQKKRKNGNSCSTTIYAENEDPEFEMKKKIIKVDTTSNLEYQPWLHDNKYPLEQDCNDKTFLDQNQTFGTKSNSVHKQHGRFISDFRNCNFEKSHEPESSDLQELNKSAVMFDHEQSHIRASQSNTNNSHFDSKNSFMLEDSIGQVGHYSKEMDHDDTKNTRAYQCDICHMKFTQFANMRRHKLSHFGVRPFECRLCPKRFFRKDHLMEHIVRQHSLQRPFRCPFCIKSFNSRPQLKAHLSLEHSGNKLCRICGFESVSVAGAKVHYSSRHGKSNSETLDGSSVPSVGGDLVQSSVVRDIDLNTVSQKVVPGMFHHPVTSSNQLVDGSKSFSTHLFCEPPSLVVAPISPSTSKLCSSTTSPMTSSITTDTFFVHDVLHSSNLTKKKSPEKTVASYQPSCLLRTHNIDKDMVRIDCPNPSFKSPFLQKIVPASTARSFCNSTPTLQTDLMRVSSTGTAFRHSSGFSKVDKLLGVQRSPSSENPDTSEASKKIVIKTEPRDTSVLVTNVKMDDVSTNAKRSCVQIHEEMSSNIDNTSETSCDSGVSGDFKEKKQENDSIPNQSSQSSTSVKEGRQKAVATEHQKIPHTSGASARKHQPCQSSDNGPATEESVNTEKMDICRQVKYTRRPRCMLQDNTSTDNCPASSKDQQNINVINRRQAACGVSRPPEDKYRAPSTSSSTDGTAETTTHIKSDPDSVNRGSKKSQDQTLVCPHCEITFLDQTLYFLHRGLHSGSNPWKCNMCGQECRDKFDFTSHVISEAHG